MSDLAARLALLPEADRRAALDGLSEADLEAMLFHWPLWARAEQLPPAECLAGAAALWVTCAGRGFGKTRTGSETIRAEVESGRRGHIVIGGPTAQAIRRDLVEGPSGILATARPGFMPTYEPSSLRLTWPSGTRGYLVSAEEYDRLRGINADFGWLDEFAAYPDPQSMLDMLLMALRLPGPLGNAPWCLITTTPRPIPAMRKLLSAESLASGKVILTRGATMDNASNLSATALELLKQRYEGTRLGRQELAGELLMDTEGAMWSHDQLEACRIKHAPELKRIVVAIDPAGGASRNSDETGVVACGMGVDGRGYVLADASGRYTPAGWAHAAVGLYDSLQADRIVAERNYGGDMVESVIRAVRPYLPVTMVTATRGKQLRAEPIASLYEQRRVSHVGNFPGLEDQMASWAPNETGPSPDRVDALVWCLTALMGQPPVQPARAVRVNIMGR